MTVQPVLSDRSRAEVFCGAERDITLARRWLLAELAHIGGREVDAVANAELVLSELATNAALWSASRGKTFDVSLHITERVIRIEVADLGPTDAPADRPAEETGGLGLSVLVEGLAEGWGVRDQAAGRVTWAAISR